MAIKDIIKSKWTKKSSDSDNEFKNTQLQDQLQDIKKSLDNKKLSFKEKVNKLSKLYQEMKTSDYKYNQKENGDLKSFWFLNTMLEKTDIKDIICVKGKLAVILHKYFTLNKVNHTYIGRYDDSNKFNIYDKVDLNNPKIYREIVSLESPRLIVFCAIQSFWKYLRVNNLKDNLYMFQWEKDDELDGMSVFSLNPRYLKKDKFLNKLDSKGIQSWSEFFKERTKKVNKPSKFDIWQFGKHAAYNTLPAHV